MKPPMHDPVILRKPILDSNGNPIKDDRAIPLMDDIPTMARVTVESAIVATEDGQDRQASHTICFGADDHPRLGDEVKIDDDTVIILKCKARRSYSGKKIYYWVTNCGA